MKNRLLSEVWKRGEKISVNTVIIGSNPLLTKLELADISYFMQGKVVNYNATSKKLIICNFIN